MGSSPILDKISISMLKFRPLSPHLTVYSTQISSLYSIWHRITGVCNLLLLLVGPILIKLFVWGRIFETIYLLQTANLLFKFVAGSFFLSFFYHLLTGCRHLLWDLNIGLTTKLVIRSSFILASFVILLSVLNWISIFH
uniref:Succinate:cytochrome c oxidoreductase subunit 3 n=1 Tax=Hildenbrandia rubra TaxID=31481 RepID=A0A0A7A7S8_9FLOR|nr:succinate:cytochrome c oxidoreductase subunit 3 [Hildenbrandia rubra]AHB62134.1 succinate:cytochrome c oxidoreductase subunit 3 [Hildenbrandia rubra]